MLMDGHEQRRGDPGPLRSTAPTRFWVTCYTDASFRPKGAGWAVWLRSLAGRVLRRGPCPPYVKNSLDAELSAIFAGVYVAWRTWGGAVRGVVIRTDCQSAIDLLSGVTISARFRRRWPGTIKLCTKIRAFADEHDIELDLRWVKGHQKGNTVQAYLNKECDRLAGEVAKRSARAGAQRAYRRSGAA